MRISPLQRPLTGERTLLAAFALGLGLLLALLWMLAPGSIASAQTQPHPPLGRWEVCLLYTSPSPRD